MVRPDAVREVTRLLSGTGLPLTVDAHGAYEWPDHERELRAIDDFGLLYIELPLPPDELLGHATLDRALHTASCGAGTSLPMGA